MSDEKPAEEPAAVLKERDALRLFLGRLRDATGVRHLDLQQMVQGIFDQRMEDLGHITALLMAMDEWAKDDGGVHPDAWDAYVAARAHIHQPLPREVLEDNSGYDDGPKYPATKPLGGR